MLAAGTSNQPPVVAQCRTRYGSQSVLKTTISSGKGDRPPTARSSRGENPGDDPACRPIVIGDEDLVQLRLDHAVLRLVTPWAVCGSPNGRATERPSPVARNSPFFAEL
jgi:hypothetical protein